MRAKRRKRTATTALVLLFLLVLAALLLAGNAILGNPLALPVSTASITPSLPTPVLVYGHAHSPSAAPSPSPAEAPTPALEVYFIDVGQGDCILLRSPNGKTMLVDAGEPGNFDTIDALLKALGTDSLDVVVSTHAHSDHAGSLPDVIRAYPVGAFYWNTAAGEDRYDPALVSALADKGIAPIPAYATMLSTIEWDKDVTVRILSPFETARYEDMNESSTVLHIQYGITSVLLAADTGALAERLMRKALPDAYLMASVLKLGHHGSYSSTTEAFLSAVDPLLAVATCGKDNAYGHPHEEIRALLAKNEIPLVTTAEYGTIHILLDGTAVRVVE